HPSEVVSVWVTGRVAASFPSGEETRHYGLQPNQAYTLVQRDGRPDMTVIRLAGDSELPPESAIDGRLLPSPKPVMVPVKLLVDDDEPAVQSVWEPRLRSRLAEASDILQRHCGVQLEVVAVGTWQSDNGVNDFGQSLAEFERKVRPSPAMLAIGFTSQYHIPPRHVPLGGTRGPLYPWILIREWSQHVTTSERLEVLVHELGHVFGAAHSPESVSVMRPMLGDRQSHARSFRIGFDPLNTLAMCLLTNELRHAPFRGFASIRPEGRESLRQVYAALSRAMPDDPAAKRYLEFFQPQPTAE
ncbi:MAG: hypothetical protein U1E05_16050, partial [Patescibacteria group bacterium]|nr:hypothetical protein [Patescibacteria group bacterium]